MCQPIRSPVRFDRDSLDRLHDVLTGFFGSLQVKLVETAQLFGAHVVIDQKPDSLCFQLLRVVEIKSKTLEPRKNKFIIINTRVEMCREAGRKLQTSFGDIGSTSLLLFTKHFQSQSYGGQDIRKKRRESLFSVEKNQFEFIMRRSKLSSLLSLVHLMASALASAGACIRRVRGRFSSLLRLLLARRARDTCADGRRAAARQPRNITCSPIRMRVRAMSGCCSRLPLGSERMSSLKRKAAAIR